MDTNASRSRFGNGRLVRGAGGLRPVIHREQQQLLQHYRYGACLRDPLYGQRVECDVTRGKPAVSEHNVGGQQQAQHHKIATVKLIENAGQAKQRQGCSMTCSCNGQRQRREPRRQL